MSKGRHCYLCLIDVRVPVVNGRELCQYIEQKRLQLVNRVVFSTGDIIGRTTMAFLEKADRPYLPEPFSPGDLRAVVTKTLKRRC